MKTSSANVLRSSLAQSNFGIRPFLTLPHKTPLYLAAPNSHSEPPEYKFKKFTMHFGLNDLLCASPRAIGGSQKLKGLHENARHLGGSVPDVFSVLS
jgi:hypothetical protein